MDERGLISEIEQDLRLAASTQRVVYLEGLTDVPILVALLGRPVDGVIPDEGTVIDGVLIRGLRDRSGSGCQAVRLRLDVAERRGYREIIGVVDGDGDNHDEPGRSFDAPFDGPLFTWPTYCIENLLAQAGWPSDTERTRWGPSPEWPVVLRDYAPYAALNRVIAGVQKRLETLGILRYAKLQSDAPLKSADEIRQQLREDSESSQRLGDPGALFDEELTRCHAVLDRGDLVRAHALINGKWLVDDLARRRTRRLRAALRDEWIAHVSQIGGHPAVKAWWQRLRAA